VLPALLLTAGLGTRLDPLTRLLAKPAMPLGGRTLVEHIVTWLARSGVRDVVLNLHHLPSTVTAVVGDGRHLGVRARYSWEQPVLGSAGGPRHALPLIDSDPFLIVNGDTLCDGDLAALVEAHRTSGAEVTMALVPNPAPDRYGGVVLDEHDAVRGFRPRGQARNTWHFVGIQVAQARVFEALPDGVPAETVAGLYREIIATDPGRIRGHRTTVGFADIGTPRDYLDTALQMGGAPVVDGETALPHVAASARVTRSLVWPGASVGAGVVLDRCIVAGAVHVPDGVQARDSVIVPAFLKRAGEAATVVGDAAVFPLPLTLVR
jgi:NDP-sugar pyrophosphorylase family protein